MLGNGWYFVDYVEFIDVVVEVAVGGWGGLTVELGIEGVVACVVLAEDAAGEGVGDEAVVTLEAADVGVVLVEVVEELLGCQGFVLRDYLGEDFLDCGSLDDGVASGVGSRGGYEFLGEVLVVDVEGEGELVVAGYSLDALYDGCCSLVGETEDVAGDGEKAFADGASGALCPADEVVADAEEGGVVVVEVFPDHEVEVIGEIVAAVDGEVVEVVDDDERGLEVVDDADDAVKDAVVAIGEGAEGVKANELEIVLGNVEVLLEVVDDAAAGVEGVDGVDPEDPGGLLGLVAVVLGYLDGMGEGVAGADNGACEHLGEGVCPAVACSSEDGDLVLMEHRAAVDADKGVGTVVDEVVHVDVETEALPGVEIVGEEWFAVVVHGDCGLKLLLFYRGKPLHTERAGRCGGCKEKAKKCHIQALGSGK